MHRKIFYYLLFLSLMPVLVMAGTKGRIKGKVVDLQTGEPLIGANVLVVGTTVGSATDASGEFILLNLEAGTYTVRASYLGYQSITISNVRVNADLTTNVDFQLPAEGIDVGTVEIVAKKPLIQKDNTNAVRITSSEDIAALPVRSVTGIIGLSAGVVLQDNAVFIRGGRIDEVGYYLEGTSVTNPMVGGRAVSVSQDAIEEVQVQAGGMSAEFGGANAGIVRQQLKSGGNEYKASFEYITDNVTFKSRDDAYDGERRLGANWYGYNEMSAVLSGPLLDNRIKFFANVSYNFQRDANPQPYPGVDIGPVTDPTTGDSINFVYPAGAIKGNKDQTYNYVGTLNIDLNPVLIRLSGTFADRTYDPYRPILASMFNDRLSEARQWNGTLNLKLTHIISPEMFYEVSAGYFYQEQNIHDQYLGSNFWAYGDSVANANVGFVWDRSERDMTRLEGVSDRRYQTPFDWNLFGFAFTRPGATSNINFSKWDRRSINLSASLSYNIGKTHAIKIGGEFQQYTMRNYSLSRVSRLYARDLNQRILDNPGVDVNTLKEELLINTGVNNYGYDVLGNEYDGDGFYAPHKPIFAGAYIQDKIEYEDIILNLGLRFDYIDVDNLMLVDETKPQLGIDYTSNRLYEEGWTDVPTFSSVSPRIGISFPVTDRTVFHAQFGKFVQQSRLIDIYQGYHRTAYENTQSNFFGSPAAKNLRPTRTTQYEIGFTQQLTDFLSFDITGYYKDIKDQVVFTLQTLDETAALFNAANTLTNGDFATTKGIEVSLTMRRYERLLMNANLSFMDARGTGSYPNSNRGIIGAPVDNVVFNPVYISPLEYNNAFRANMNLDYRFGVNDGGAILEQMGASLLVKYSSGHPYTRGTGGSDLEGDARNRAPVEPLGSSTTPSTIQFDLRIDKTFNIYDKLSANVYIYVINLFDAKNIENVFLRTGTADDDGYLGTPGLGYEKALSLGPDYVAMYKAINLDYYEQYQAAGNLQTVPYFYGSPRQIRLGVRFEY